jgi:hypothetical protein
LSFTGLPAGNYTVSADPLGGRTVAAQTVTVGAGATNVNFVYTLACTTGTGGG